MPRIGERLKAAREANDKMTQQQLANASGMSRDQIAALETNRRSLSLHDAAVFARVLGVDVEELVDDEAVTKALAEVAQDRLDRAQRLLEFARKEFEQAKAAAVELERQ
jgi:transcriptional regulator with XRE-family HTH domain